jgi:hypothetical protein
MPTMAHWQDWTSSLSGTVSLLQYPLVALAVDDKAAVVNIGLAVALLALFPFFIWLHQREKSIRYIMWSKQQ